MIKAPVGAKRWQSGGSLASKGGFVGVFGEDSTSQLGEDKNASSSSSDENPSLFSRIGKKRPAEAAPQPLADATSKTNSESSSLAMALKASRGKNAAKKMKSSAFLSKINGDDSSRQGKSGSSMAGSKSLVASHVLFDTNSKSQFNKSSDGFSNLSRPSTVTPGIAKAPEKAGRQTSSSLWSKIKAQSTFK